jgi:hypothetical protein
MIFHNVWLIFKPSTTLQEREMIFEQIRALEQKIPGITRVIVGANLNTTEANRGYTHGFTLIFDTEEHFRAYAPHPEHQPVSQALQQACQSILDFDLLQE